jgi:hypothetical protein
LTKRFEETNFDGSRVEMIFGGFCLKSDCHLRRRWAGWQSEGQEEVLAGQ